MRRYDGDGELRDVRQVDVGVHLADVVAERVRVDRRVAVAAVGLARFAVRTPSPGPLPRELGRHDAQHGQQSADQSAAQVQVQFVSFF